MQVAETQHEVSTDCLAASQIRGSRHTEPYYYTPEEIRQHAGELAGGAQGAALRALEPPMARTARGRAFDLDRPPDSPEARELAARWDDIHERARPLFQGDEKLWQSLGRAHLDGQYDHIEEAGHAQDYAFIRRVKTQPGCSTDAARVRRDGALTTN